MSETSPLEILACSACGGMNPEGANFCQHCGAPLAAGNVNGPETVDTSTTTAISVEDLRRYQDESDAGEPQHTVAFRTDIGRKHRVNQDAGDVWAGVRSDGVPVTLLIVADGVSAGRHSEVASRLVVEAIRGRLLPLLQDSSQGVESILDALLAAIKSANHEVAARPHEAISHADATTIVTAFAVGTTIAGAWVGDSRAYRISGGAVERLTTDHSWAEGVVSRGLMTVEQASRDPRAHMIMRWLGPPDQDDPGVETFAGEIQPGDVVLCCTDGLYGYFSPPVAEEEEMAAILTAPGVRLEDALEQLVQVALARGGHDNITAAGLRVEVAGRAAANHETQELSVPARESLARTVQIRLGPLGEEPDA